MKKLFIYSFISLFISYFGCCILLEVEIKKRFENLRMEYDIGNSYYIAIDNLTKETLKLKSKEFSYGGKIGEILKLHKTDNAYIGYLKPDETDKNNSYFYISENKKLFGLNEFELKEILKQIDKNITFNNLFNKEPLEYILSSKKIGYIKGDFKILIKKVITLGFIITLFLSILLIKNDKKLKKIYFNRKNPFLEKRIRYVFIIFLIFHLISSYLIVEELRLGDYYQNFGIGLNEKYYIEINGVLDKEITDVRLYEIDTEKRFGNIEKLSKNGFYYIGYLVSRDSKECNSYFYINMMSSEDTVFDLEEKEIVEKFGDIKFETPNYYIKKYGIDSEGFSIEMFKWRKFIYKLPKNILFIIILILIFMKLMIVKLRDK